MRVTCLGSGSSGNAYLIEAGPQGRTRLLVDAGFSGRVLNERLRLANCSANQLQGVLITHEHSDHILGLPFLMKNYQIPAIADPRTLTVIEEIFSVGELRSEGGAFVRLETVFQSESGALSLHAEADLRPSAPEALSRQLWQPLPEGSRRTIGDIEVQSFPVSHDAIAPCGYLLSAGGCRVCLITDTGEITQAMLQAISQSDLLILESNHDRARLLSGPYPYHLKQRILSSVGHLSNAQAAEAVLRTWRNDGLRWLWLAHLSRTNNTPKLALTSMQKSLRDASANLNQIHITILRREIGSSWDSTQLWQQPSLWHTDS